MTAEYRPPFGLDLASVGASPAADVAAADHAARNWVSEAEGPLRPGTEAHKRAATRMFHETFNPYKPSVIDWPKLSADGLARLVALPIWNIAVQTEGKARVRMAGFARSLTDQPWRDAIGLNAWEESRHKMVLSHLVAAYGIPLEPEPAYPPPRHTEWAYLVTGFSECIDSFFAFGLFALAARSAFFPAALVETFEPVIQEECRHILLFANWLAAHRSGLGVARRVWFELRVAAAWVFLGWERVGLAREGVGAPQDHKFTINGAKSVSTERFSVGGLLRLCLAENDRRFAGYDRRLRRPATVPWLARLACRVVPG